MNIKNEEAVLEKARKARKNGESNAAVLERALDKLLSEQGEKDTAENAERYAKALRDNDEETLREIRREESDTETFGGR